VCPPSDSSDSEVAGGDATHRNGTRSRRWLLWCLGAGALAVVSTLAVMRRHHVQGGSSAPAIAGCTLLRARNDGGLAEYRHEASGLTLVLLAGGDFEMGDAEGVNDSSPVHRVRLAPFLISKYEVSERAWALVIGDDPASTPGGEDLPRTKISWFECERYCAEVGLRLPTEAQWEFACRAGGSAAYAFGDRLTHAQANFAGWGDDDSSGMVAVDAFPPNGFGLHNVHGNAAEWCRDAYAEEAYAGRSGSLAVDPFVETNESGSRIRRGGSSVDEAFPCRSGSRSELDPNVAHENVGFRPVLELRGAAIDRTRR